MNPRLLKFGVPLLYLLLLIPVIQWGVGISHDSCNYLSAAELPSLNGAWQNCDGSAFTNWPFLFPALLYLLTFLPFPLLISAGILQVIIAMLSYTLLSKLVKPQYLILLAALFMLPAFAKPYLMLWTEPLFILLLIVACYIRITEGSPFVLILSMAAACLTRYAGMFIVVGLIIGECLTHKRYTRLCSYYLLALIPVALNLIYNASYQVKIIESNLTLRQWDVLVHNLLTGANVLLIPLHAALYWCCYFLYRHTTTVNKPLLVAIPLYWSVILVFDPLSAPEIGRYLLPVLPLLLLSLNDTNRTLPQSPFLQKLILVFGVTAFVLTTTYATYSGPGGYNKRTFENPELVDLLQQHATHPVYSNAPDYLYFLTKRTTHWLHNTPDSTAANSLFIQITPISRRQEQLSRQITVEGKQIKGKNFTGYILP